MVEKFCFYFGLKNGAIFMSFLSLLTGAGLLLLCFVELFRGLSPRYNSFVVIGILGSITSIAGGLFLLSAILKGKERHVLIYMLLQSIVLLIMTIYTGMFIFTDILYTICFLLTGFLWYGVYCTYSFYQEIADYNDVKPEVFEITYQENGAYKTQPQVNNENSAV